MDYLAGNVQLVIAIFEENTFIHLLNKTSHLIVEVASFAFVVLSCNYITDIVCNRFLKMVVYISILKI